MCCLAVDDYLYNETTVCLLCPDLATDNFFWLSCHISSSLRLFVPSSLHARCHLFFWSTGTDLPEVVGAATATACKLSVDSSSVLEQTGYSIMT
jgi:hypothetical protein